MQDAAHWSLQEAASLWEETQLRSTAWSDRQEERDLARWERMAVRFDAEHSLARSCPALLSRLEALIQPGWSLLDLGAGTGEFALPLASRAALVTAVDYSPPMLARLRAKALESGIGNLVPVQGRWEEANVTSHDLVLAVNALYRTRYLASALVRLESLARQAVAVASYEGSRPDYRALLRDSVGLPPYRDGARGDLLQAALLAWGRQPVRERFLVERKRRYVDLKEAADELARGLPAEEEPEIQRGLEGLLDREGGGYLACWQQEVALIHWVPREERKG